MANTSSVKIPKHRTKRIHCDTCKEKRLHNWGPTAYGSSAGWRCTGCEAVKPARD